MKLNSSCYEQLNIIEKVLRRSSVPSEVREEVDEELGTVYRELASLESKNAFENHMAEFISQAAVKRENDERGPLCSCSNPTCPLTEGRVPPQVRIRGGPLFSHRKPEDLVSDYLMDHPGAEVMHEMIRAWHDREGDLYRRTQRIHAQLSEYEEIRNIAHRR